MREDVYFLSTQRRCTSIKTVSKSTPIFMGPCETLELVLSAFGLGVSWSQESLSGHELHQLPCLKNTLQSSSVPIFFMSSVLLEVMNLLIGVILCKVIWGIGPQTSFFYVARLFTLLPIKGTCSVAQFNCVPHIPPWGLGY